MEGRGETNRGEEKRRGRRGNERRKGRKERNYEKRSGGKLRR